MTKLQSLYKELGEYLLMLASVEVDKTELIAKIELRCFALVETIKKENQNIFE